MVKRTLIGFICFLFITSCSFFEIKPSGTPDDVCLSAPKTSRICSVAKGLNWNLTDMNNKIMKANLVAIASGQITCKEITDTTSEIRNLLIALPRASLAGGTPSRIRIIAQTAPCAYRNLRDVD